MKNFNQIDMKNEKKMGEKILTFWIGISIFFG